MANSLNNIRNLVVHSFLRMYKEPLGKAGILGTPIILALGIALFTMKRWGLNVSFPTQILHGLISKIKSINPVAAKADLSLLPADLCKFKPLLQKTQRLVSFKDFNPGCRHHEDELPHCTREIIMGSTPNQENAIFIKFPMGKHIFVRQKRAKNEQLAFLISHRLALNVVPITMALEGYEQLITSLVPQSISERLKQGMSPLNPLENNYAGVVIQEGLLLHKNQLHVKKNPLMSFETFGLDMDQVHRAVLFNLIVGRMDADRHNTIIDSSKKIMEHDNEKLGAKHSDSWLLNTFAETIISRKVLDDFLNHDVSLIKEVFQEMKQFDFEPTLEPLIIENFEKIHQFLSADSKNEIKVCDLVQILKPKL